MTSSHQRSLLLLTLVAATLALLACGSTITARAESIEVIHHAFTQSRGMPRAPRVGQWVHGGSVDEDAAFFAEEDTTYASWLRWKRELLVFQEQAARDTDKTVKEGDDADGGTGDDVSGKKAAKKIAAASKRAAKALKEAFSDNAATQRILARNTALRNATMSHLEKATVFHKASGNLQKLLSHTRLFSSPLLEDEESPEALYVHLINTSFVHTAAHHSSDVAGQAIQAIPSSPWLTALHYPMVLDGGVLAAALRETHLLKMEIATFVRKLKNMTRVRPVEENKEDTAGVPPRTTTEEEDNAESQRVALEVQASIDTLLSSLEADERALRLITRLSSPLLPMARAAAHVEQRILQERFLANDESTEALRREMKELLKHRARLREWEAQLSAASKDFQDAERKRELPNKQTLVICLALIARYRLGSTNTSFSALDALPDLSPVPLLTGALESEWTSAVLIPFALGMAVSVVLGWVLLELKFCLLLRARAAQRRKRHNNTTNHTGAPSVSPSSSTGMVAISAPASVKFVSLLSLVIPLVVPLTLVVFRARGLDMPLSGLAAYLHPAQRLTVGVVFAALLLVSELVIGLVGRIYVSLNPSTLGARKKKPE